MEGQIFFSKPLFRDPLGEEHDLLRATCVSRKFY